MTDTIPPDDDTVGEETGELCLATRMLNCQQQHRELDSQIEELYDFPHRDQLLLQRLKRKKLQLKDSIERLHSKLIPDLDA